MNNDEAFQVVQANSPLRVFITTKEVSNSEDNECKDAKIGPMVKEDSCLVTIDLEKEFQLIDTEEGKPAGDVACTITSLCFRGCVLQWAKVYTELAC